LSARRERNPQAGLTLVEIMISVAILAFMMSLAWTTTTNTGDVKKELEASANRAHEVRAGLARVVRDLEHVYLSRNEDLTVTERRTLLVGKDGGGEVDELRFSSLAHEVLWADANEADTTLISYYAGPDPDKKQMVDWLRREQRRLTDPQESDKEAAAEVDVVLRDIIRVDFEYWDWKDQEWRVDWDTTKVDGKKDRLPTRVRITVSYRDAGIEEKISTQARLSLQEPVESRFGTQYEQGN